MTTNKSQPSICYSMKNDNTEASLQPHSLLLFYCWCSGKCVPSWLKLNIIQFTKHKVCKAGQLPHFEEEVCKIMRCLSSQGLWYAVDSKVAGKQCQDTMRQGGKEENISASVSNIRIIPRLVWCFNLVLTFWIEILVLPIMPKDLESKLD